MLFRSIVNSLRRTSFRCSNSLVSFEQRHRRTRLNCKTSESSTSHLEAQAVLLECKLAWGKTLDNRKNNGTTCLKKKGSKFKRKRGRTLFISESFSCQHSQTLLVKFRVDLILVEHVPHLPTILVKMHIHWPGGYVTDHWEFRVDLRWHISYHL